MGQVFEGIDERLRGWLLAQPMFVVATAPAEGGHVNASPKGMAGTFTVLGETSVAYLDYTGSGAETIAHLRENGRITLMFNAFDGPPRIVRLQGTGRVVVPEDEEFAQLRPRFAKSRQIGQRSIIVVECDRIADSCGWSVPVMQYVADRDVLDLSQERRDEEYFATYWAAKNAESIDGLPALQIEPLRPSRRGPAGSA
ncbi:pyridoxamine 5'-phosphate oxidase family protein [Nocardioides mangrovicus]|uniref:Pyridoxamine 5'-phosphate oxidase family protein n=1 Tax=Nocardioides mangrovicus TaxID=2478913 RepID=A0A3L8P265_9ACTN|nr:pyridoxamine 5'-phosphate oxidase family protein [Nocardioides mangrovicus]RLV48923.1 pyridoxamine 5'-phosphate oxidase family protein [Nocardioides mangrovicus]